MSETANTRSQQRLSFNIFFWAVLPLAAMIVCAGINWLLPLAVAEKAPHIELFLPNVLSALKPEPLETAAYLFIICFMPLFYLAAYFAVLRLNPDNWPDKSKRYLFQAAIFVQIVFSALVLANSHMRVNFGIIAETAAFCAAGIIASFVFVLLSGGQRQPQLTLPVFSGRPGLASVLRRMFYVLCGAVLIVGLMPAVFTNNNVGNAHINMLVHLPYTMGEFAAVLNGRSPGVDFFPQYQNLLPYLFLPYFRLFGVSVTSYTFCMGLLSAAGLLLVWLTFVKTARSGVAGGALFLIFAGLAFHAQRINDTERFYIFNYYAVAPLRYIALWVTGFLLALYLEKPVRARRLWLFAAAALCVVNNPDFGVPALAGALVACFISPRENRLVVSPREMLTLCAEAAVCFSGAVLLFMGVTFARSGHLPDFMAMTQYQRIFAANGFMALPVPPLGLYWVLLSTFLAALVAGFLPTGENRILRGLLVFAGVSGCGAGMYYVGRSHHLVLHSIFPAWGVALALLLLFTVRAIKNEAYAREVRLGMILPLFWLLSFSFTGAANLLTLNNPLRQPLRYSCPDTGYYSTLQGIGDFVKRFIVPGEKVMLICPNAHLLALMTGTDNVFPYASSGSLILRSQAELTAETADLKNVNKVFGNFSAELAARLEARGFVKVAGINSYKFYVWERASARR